MKGKAMNKPNMEALDEEMGAELGNGEVRLPSI
jgi:hypothetical protein